MYSGKKRFLGQNFQEITHHEHHVIQTDRYTDTILPILQSKHINNNLGRTAVDEACDWGTWETVEQLINFGAKINVLAPIQALKHQSLKESFNLGA